MGSKEGQVYLGPIQKDMGRLRRRDWTGERPSRESETVRDENKSSKDREKILKDIPEKKANCRKLGVRIPSEALDKNGAVPCQWDTQSPETYLPTDVVGCDGWAKWGYLGREEGLSSAGNTVTMLNEWFQLII